MCPSLIISRMVMCPLEGYEHDYESKCDGCTHEGYADAIEYHCQYGEKEDDK